MIKCCYECIPCCDYCVHVEHEIIDGTVCGPVGCNLHKDEEHQRKAEGCGYCEDFRCENA